MRTFLIACASLVAVLSLTHCKKDTFITDSSATLNFSTDTLLFDTVFTSIGSTTHVLKVYNPHSQRINISDIYIEEGSDSQFRMNVDGVSGYSHHDIEIAANDSMYIFVEVTIDPNVEFLPFLIEDKIRFNTNGNDQHVLLQAYGQNAHFHGSLNALTWLDSDVDGDLLWSNDLPHVVYGVVAVPEGETLTILPGTQVYNHNGSGLFMYKSSIDVQGEFGAEVCFQGDRLEEIYSDEPGQWGIELSFEYEGNFGIEQATVQRGGIWLVESPGSTINYANIKNAVFGIQVDTLGSSTTKALSITNTKIENMGGSGLVTRAGASVFAYNCLIADCGETCAALTQGGEFQMYHCTFANYWSFGNRQTPTFVLDNWYLDINNQVQIRPLENTEFINCIMYGNNANQEDYSEFFVSLLPEGNPDYQFSHCLVDTEEEMDEANYTQMIDGVTPPFKDPDNHNFDLIFNDGFPDFGMDGTSVPVGNSTDIKLDIRINNEKGCYSSSVD